MTKVVVEESPTLSKAVELSPNIIFITTKTGIIEYVNQSFVDITGYSREESIGQNPRFLKGGDIDEANYTNLWKTISEGGVWRNKFRNMKKNGELFWVATAINPIVDKEGKITHFVAIQEDITELKKTQLERDAYQTQLVQSQKLEALGTLAAGVAHDFSNFLSVIMGSANRLKRELSNCEKPIQRTKCIDKIYTIEDSANRAAELAKQLLLFAKHGEFQPIELPLNKTVLETQNFLRQTLSNAQEVLIKSDLDPNLWTIQADSSQMLQVLLNLGLNATSAMPDGGELLFETTNVEIPETTSNVFLGLTPGNYVRVKVKDTGIGIPDDIAPKIFDPFFTTKGTETGTGLGLSTVYGIVQQHHGAINIDSKIGEGTSFSVYLPASTTSSCV